MKKTLALVLAFALVFSTMTMAFADDAAAISADAKICADLGMLVGDGSGVTPAYTATSPNRLQAAVMFLRLKGLEAEANAFTGTDTFADAKKVAWGQPVMAYLKAHPELGWIGDGTNFDPASAMTAQQYYKVMLEALGYKQNTATVVGDFTWENVMTFAASKGLTKNAAVTSFTVNDLAVATVEALKATVKDGNKTLIATLVEAGKVDKAKAIASGVMADAATTDAKLDSVVASANDKVEVTFDADVAKDFAENVANYKVVVKGSTTALEVKSAKAVNSTIVELATAVQTGGTAYTLTVGTVSKNFAGLAKSNAVPELDTVKCIDTNTVEVTFKKIVDRASAEDAANYTLNNGATVAKAELWIDQDDSRQTVKLTTEGVAGNKVYKLKIANVKSADLVAMKTVEKSFSGVTDTKAPSIKGNIVVANNQRIFVVFDDVHGVDQASVENVANWSIDGLTINSIKAKSSIKYNGTTYGRPSSVDPYGYFDLVEVNTEPMTANHKYTVTISNLVDGSTSKNAIAKALTKTFYGMAVDKTAPTMGVISIDGDSIVEIPFKDTNRLDTTTATDVNNYTFNEGLQVLSAKILRSSKPDDSAGKTVILTTSTMDKGTTYKVTVQGVADEFGNVMTTVSNRQVPRVIEGNSITPPSVKNIVWDDKNTIEVNFSKRLDIDSAEDPANYSLSGGIGTVRNAEIDLSNLQTVTLTVPDLTINKNYTLTINGVKDRLGNEMTNYTAAFTAGTSSVDLDAPEIDNINVVSNKEIQVTFNEPVEALATAKLTINKVKDNGDIDYDPAAQLTADVQGVARSKYTIDEGMTAIFRLNSGSLSTNYEYAITGLINLTDKHSNLYSVSTDDSDKERFYGNSENPDAPEVTAVDQINVRKLLVTFSQPVVFNGVTKSAVDHKLTVGNYELVIDADNLKTTDALSTVTIKKNDAKFGVNTEYKLSLASILDYAGVGLSSSDKEYKYTTYLEDKEAPTIDYVEAVSTSKVQVHFNEEIDEDNPGSYTVKGIFGSVSTERKFDVRGVLDGDDETVVNLDVSGLGMKKGEVYTLIPKTGAKDIAGNQLSTKDLSFEFVASAVDSFDYIKGVAVIDARTVEVRTTNETTGVTINITNEADVVIGTGVSGTASTATKILLSEALLADETYTASINGYPSYEFDGILSDGDIRVDKNNDVIIFSNWDTGNYVVKVVYNGAVIGTIGTVTAGSGYDASSVLVPANILADSKYMIEVYRKVNGVTESAPLYAKRYVRGQED